LNAGGCRLAAQLAEANVAATGTNSTLVVHFCPPDLPVKISALSPRTLRPGYATEVSAIRAAIWQPLILWLRQETAEPLCLLQNEFGSELILQRGEGQRGERGERGERQRGEGQRDEGQRGEGQRGEGQRGEGLG